MLIRLKEGYLSNFLRALDIYAADFLTILKHFGLVDFAIKNMGSIFLMAFAAAIPVRRTLPGLYNFVIYLPHFLVQV